MAVPHRLPARCGLRQRAFYTSPRPAGPGSHERRRGKRAKCGRFSHGPAHGHAKRHTHGHRNGYGQPDAPPLAHCHRHRDPHADAHPQPHPAAQRA
ncbi:MAG: hypothetical protein PHU95_05215, partial [Candidatus Thermoplasmatota archaeon]|nr:hypothetical protein [Candidatus Thermoplasmatota archaeon]